MALAADRVLSTLRVAATRRLAGEGGLSLTGPFLLFTLATDRLSWNMKGQPPTLRPSQSSTGGNQPALCAFFFLHNVPLGTGTMSLKSFVPFSCLS